MKKQIEEMTKCENCVHHEMCIDKISCGVLTADKDGLLKLECKYYQPKLPEDSVILSREEYDDMFSFKTTRGGFYNILDTVRKVERKETAEKIWFRASTIVNKTKHLVQGREYLHLDALKEIIKQFGVDLGE
jgi:hypothetical protein